MEYAFQKPLSLSGYPLHRIAADMADGEKVIFADRGDHMLLRTSKRLELQEVAAKSIRVGGIFGFELRACVGKKVKGCHRYFKVEDWRSRHEWLERQGVLGGFSLMAIHCVAGMTSIIDNERNFKVDQTDFTGVLKIEDESLFFKAMENGVGNKARAFGFGMLII